jgi:methionyl-tRNA formyltransferase
MKTIILAGKGKSTTFLYNALKDDFDIEKVVIEEKVDIKKFIKRRIKRLGYFSVFNQLLFQSTIPKILSYFSKKRVAELKMKYNLSSVPIPEHKILNVPSVNSKESINFLKDIDPTVVIVNGTRIISTKVLKCTKAKFINTHVGITPFYRGVHGAYWALVANDIKNCGVTIHEVDQGIDTGLILKQARITISKNDNFTTYPYHQYGVSIAPMKTVLNEIKNNTLVYQKKSFESGKLYYHPTFTGYLYHRIFKGVK